MPGRAAILGRDEAAAGWAARFLLCGWEVRVPGAGPAALDAVLAAARRAFPGLWDVALPGEGRLIRAASAGDTTDGADWVQTGDGALPGGTGDAIVAVASGDPATVAGWADRPERVVGVAALDPVYLLPWAEVVLPAAASGATAAQVRETLVALGFAPVWREGGKVGAMGAALTEAVAAAARDLVARGIANPGQVEAALAHGVAPPLLIESAAPESDRDTALVAALRGLKAHTLGAGAALRQADAAHPPAAPDMSGPVLTQDRAVPLDWTDYNGHMNEARYLQAFGDATDRLMEVLGCDAGYVEAGYSFFTAETHIRHIDEVRAGTRFRVETTCLQGQGPKLHIFHRMHAGERLLATGEHFLLHVSLETRRPCPPVAPVDERLAGLAAAHARLPRPEGAGRAVGQKPD